MQRPEDYRAFRCKEPCHYGYTEPDREYEQPSFQEFDVDPPAIQFRFRSPAADPCRDPGDENEKKSCYIAEGAPESRMDVDGEKAEIIEIEERVKENHHQYRSTPEKIDLRNSFCSGPGVSIDQKPS